MAGTDPDPGKTLKQFKLTAQVTISISTIVGAETAEEALRIGARREVGHVNLDPTYEATEYWLPGEELDGAPTDIAVERP
jgi:hypothetical protein